VAPEPNDEGLSGCRQSSASANEWRSANVAPDSAGAAAFAAAPPQFRSPDCHKDRSRFDTRYFIASADLTAERAAHAVRGHWRIENALHWTLDVVFKDDQSRLRKGHGAHNMAIVRHFALNLVRAINDRQSIKLRRKKAGWSPDYLASILGQLPR
ncbi:ISAs1 family transposase, partial [Mesorhizobium sp. ES1-3]|uniref:ISAs1 family transposase n=1 Tax=Mesorhizobium sp. ES1-3 TaxID=2876628 RepID=UPI001CCCFB95